MESELIERKLTKAELREMLKQVQKHSLEYQGIKDALAGKCKGNIEALKSYRKDEEYEEII